MHARTREHGGVFYLSVLMMTATIVFGISFLASASLYNQQQGRHLDRLRARAVADGLADACLKHLKDGGGALSVNNQPFGGATYDLDIVDKGSGNYAIVARGTVNGVSMDATSRVEGVKDYTALDSTFMVGDKIYGDVPETFSWVGVVEHEGDFDVEERGDHVPTPLEVLTFDKTALAPDVVYDGNTDLGPGTITGIIVVNGDLDIDNETDTTILGTIFVDGDVKIKGDDTSVSLLAGDDSAALYVIGRLDVKDLDAFVVQGSVFVAGEAHFHDVQVLEGRGSLYVGDKLHLKLLDDTAGSWEYDPRIQETPPLAVSGGPTQREVNEVWRRFGS